MSKRQALIELSDAYSAYWREVSSPELKKRVADAETMAKECGITENDIAKAKFNRTGNREAL